jgi:hypothetical protein
VIGLIGGPTLDIWLNRSKNWKIVKPSPMKAAAVRTQDMSVRSMLRRVRNQEKWFPI